MGLWNGIANGIGRKKSGTDWSSYWATLWAGVGGDVAVERCGSDYLLHQKIADQSYWTISLRSITTGAYTISAIRASDITHPLTRIDQTDVGITYAGAGTWSTALANAQSYGGTYARSTVADAYFEYTTPAGVTEIGIKSQFFTNSGVWLITIDGDNTLANLCLTAQQMVNAGTLPNTVLVANGGTLNPTDRVLDGYNSALFTTRIEGGLGTTGYYKLLVNGLSAGTHTLRVTATAYKNTGSGGVRIILDAIYYITNASTMAGSNFSVSDINLLPVVSVWEYAHKVLPVGGATLDFLGNTHGYDSQSTLEIKMDGSVITPADNTITSGSLLFLTRTSKLKNIDDASDVANVVTTYSLHPTTGLTVTVTITWLVNCTADTACYPAMFAFAGLIDKGSQSAVAVDVDLAVDDGTYKARANGEDAWAWDANGIYGVRMKIANITSAVGTPVNPNGHLWIEDRNDGTFLNKMYLQHSGNILANDVWVCERTYQLKKFVNADAVLTRVNW